ncbi:TIGR02597 family protein [Phragmitibacter flavus]|nr:TIGR02597 family protein [Phragmitibacter flavus]
MAAFSQTQEVATDPVGFVKLTVPGQSDAVLAVPFYRASVHKGMIQSINGSEIVLSGSTGWAVNQLVFSAGVQNNSYAVLISSGVKEGMIAKITANSTNSITVQPKVGDDLSQILTIAANGPQSGDLVDIVPFWTPTSLITGVPNVGTQILIKPTDSPGINLSSQTTLVYNGTSWIQSASNANHYPLEFGQSFVLRNNATSPLVLAMSGGVPMNKFRTLIRTFTAANRQDVWFGYSSPIPEAVGNLGLGFSPGDQLVVYDNATVGKNKSASQTLVYNGTAWLLGGSNVNTTFFLQPGNGYVFRKNNAALTNQIITWESLPSYLD